VSEQLVLAIDTTGEFGSLALGTPDGVIEEVLMHSPDGYGHVLFEWIEVLLQGNGIGLGDISLFAAAAGPGSFTGVRVGLTAAKGLAAATGRSAAAVSNLQALALLGEGERRAAVLDARRGEIFGAVYDAQANLLAGETVAPFGEWLEKLPEWDLQFVFLDEAPFAAALAVSRFAGAPRVSAGRALAGAVARLAWRQPTDPGLLDANYVRKSDAELFWVDK
jgi:tRNA threonylcarbamoyladenosine biosynthesis protein TsaB